MTVQAHMADGTVLEFPDGTPDAVIAKAAKSYASGAFKPRKTVAERAEGRVGTLVREAANAALPGVADRLSALTSKGRYSENLAREQAKSKADEKAHPYTSLGSSFLGAAVSPLAELKGLGGAAYGAAEGLANSHGNWLQRLKEGAVGAGEGYVGGLVGQGAAKLAGRVLKPTFSKAAQAMLNRGVRLTPGQIGGRLASNIEETLSSIPGARQLVSAAKERGLLDWNRSLYQDVLGLVGKKHNGTVGEDAIAHVERTLGNEYNRILPTLTMRADGELQRDILRIGDEAKDLPSDARKWFVNIVRNRITGQLKGKPELSGDKARDIISQIEQRARTYRASPDPAYRDAARLLEETGNAMRANLERSNPAARQELKNLNKAWAQFVRLQSASTRRATSGGIITPGDLLQAAKSADKSLRKGSFARGTAMLQKEAKQAHEIITNKVPNSHTADRTLAAAALFDAPHLVAHAKLNPFKTLMALSAAGAYTKSGQDLVNRLARRAATSGKARNALAQFMARTQPRFGTLGAAGTVSGLNALSPPANGTP